MKEHFFKTALLVSLLVFAFFGVDINLVRADILTPSNLAATVLPAGQINLTWKDNSNNETAFAVERSTDGTAFMQIGVTPLANISSYASGGLLPNTTYYYRVRAINATENSLYSNIANAKTLNFPQAPSNLVVQETVPGQITLSWQDNSSNETGFSIWRIDSHGASSYFPVEANVTTFSHDGAQPGAGYSYNVKALGAGGLYSYSNSVTITTSNLPVAPSNLSAVMGSGGVINLKWKDNSINETGFKVEKSTDGVSFNQFFVTSANATSTYDTGLVVGTRYYYRVRAVNATGHSPYSNISSSTIDPVVPPSNLAGNVVSSSKINLTWKDNTTNETGFIVYRWKQGMDASVAPGIATLAENVTAYTDTGLSADTKYYYKVSAAFNDGRGTTSTPSNIINLTTSSALPAPRISAATVISSTQINIAWQDNSSTETGFTIERGTNGTTFTQVATVAANTITYNDTQLQSGTKYYYRLKATSAIEDSTYSNIINRTTVVVAPTAPSGLVATPISTTQINLTWTDNSNSETGFKVERSLDGIAFSQFTTVGASILEQRDYNLKVNTKYYYRVRATNTSGNSTYSNVANATTFDVVVAPSNIVNAAVSSTQIDITWQDNSSNETGFQIERSTTGYASGSVFTLIGTTGANITTYSDTGLLPNKIYYYRVRANGVGGFSNYITSHGAITSVLVAPSNLVATAVSSSKIQLTWTDNSNNETVFKIERSKDGVTFALIASVLANTTTYANTGLSANTRYYYRVQASNVPTPYNGIAAYSPYSNVAQAATLCSGSSCSPH